MSMGGVANKNHEKYEEYARKCKEVADVWFNEKLAIDLEHGEIRGFEKRPNEKHRIAREQYKHSINKLREEYSFLFV